MMRAKTQIPVGDLFTVMESWDDGDRIKRSMDVILQLEAQASAALTPQPGLPELLAFLRSSGVKVGLVTRNTTESLDAFFGAVGEGWRDVFDVCLTRDNTPYVKPDPRSLLHFAEVGDGWARWRVQGGCVACKGCHGQASGSAEQHGGMVAADALTHPTLHPRPGACSRTSC